VTDRGIARRYAHALFDVVSDDRADLALGDLRGFAQLLAGHAELRRVLDTPTVPPQRKKAIVEAVIDAAGGVVPEVRRLLGLLADRDRLMVVTVVADAFAARVMASRQVLPAEIVTAIPLADEQRSRIAGALKRATGSDITMRERVDPGIVGGLIARVGSVVFDGSVTRHLQRLRDRLLAGV
jgi:F-type H+-transporting ATPase subunit delta